MWKWPFQADCKRCSHASIKKSPGPRHISVLESCRTNLALLPSCIWLTGSGLPLVLWYEHAVCVSCCTALIPVSECWGGGHMHVLLTGFCRLFCQGRGWEQKDQQNYYGGSRTSELGKSAGCFHTFSDTVLNLRLFLGLCSHMSQIQSALRYVRLGDTEKIHLSFSLNCLTLKVCEGQTHQWKKNAWYCRVMSHCKQKRGWDSGSLRHPLFVLAHVPSQGSGFYNCLLLWCWGAHVHINMVVVHWNNEENRNVERRISATAGCACTRTGFDFPPWLSLCWVCGSTQSTKGVSRVACER